MHSTTICFDEKSIIQNDNDNNFYLFRALCEFFNLFFISWFHVFIQTQILHNLMFALNVYVSTQRAIQIQIHFSQFKPFQSLFAITHTHTYTKPKYISVYNIIHK